MKGLPVVQHPVDPATHKGRPARGHHWACSIPELPGGPRTAWSSDCHACVVHMAATLAANPDMAHRQAEFRASDENGEPGPPVMVGVADSLAVQAEERWGDPIIAGIAIEAGGDPERAREAFRQAV